MSVKINSVLLNKTNIKADSITYPDKLNSPKAKVCKHSGIFDQSSPILESFLLKVMIIEVKSFRNVYNTKNAGELFQLINRHVSVSKVLKC